MQLMVVILAFQAVIVVAAVIVAAVVTSGPDKTINCRQRYEFYKADNHLFMKHLISIILVCSLCHCGSINTPNDGINAIYNTTSAVIQGKDSAGKCEQGHQDDRRKCEKATQTQTKAITESIKKHQKGSDTAAKKCDVCGTD